MKIVLVVLFTLLIGYILYCVIFYVAQRKILFPTAGLPPHNSQLIFDAGGELIPLDFSQGKFEIAYLPAKTESAEPVPVLLLAHGNGNIIDDWAGRMDLMRERGYAVVLVEFPGYGRSEGLPSYQTIQETMKLAYRWVLDQQALDNNQINLIGRSMGGGAVLSLLDANSGLDKSLPQPKTVVLMSTYISVADMAWRRGIPSIVVRDHFDNAKALQEFSGRSYLIHGQKDKVIPFDSMARLVTVAKNARHKAYSGGHNDVPDNWYEFWMDVAQFIEE